MKLMNLSDLCDPKLNVNKVKNSFKELSRKEKYPLICNKTDLNYQGCYAIIREREGWKSY